MSYYDGASSKEISKSLQTAMVLPVFTILIMVLVMLTEVLTSNSFSAFGVIPRKIEGLIGIITGPLVHGGFEHLMNNAVSLFLFGTALFFFYRRIAIKVWLVIYFASSALVWIFARGGASHVGISGVIYGLGFFLFFSGMMRKNRRLAVLSLLLTLFYGSMIWGVLPGDPKISWEAHLMGAILGVGLAIYFRHSPTGIEHFDPPRRPSGPDIIGDEWKMEDPNSIEFGISYPPENEIENPQAEPQNHTQPRTHINYIFKPREEGE
jgi:membrane associated rhomboid family serine protease